MSPDGRWIAYTVRIGSTGSSQVFLRPFPNVGGERRQVSIEGGSKPVWAPNSRAIFYSQTGAGIFRVDLTPAGQLGTPVLALAVDGADATSQSADTAIGDGRFVRIQPMLDKGKANELRIVLHWFEVLTKKVAGGS